MSTTFRPTTPDDRPALSKLLADVFGSPPESSLLHPALMAWKYWDPRPDYPEPRSYVLESDGEFIGHVGLWPLDYAGVRGVHMIDWAASRNSPGAGISMVQRVARMFEFIVAIGGSETTRKVLPAFGFKEVAQSWEAARPLRPLPQILSHQNRNWKLAARLARNSWWALSPAVHPPAAWGIQEISPSAAGSLPTRYSFARTPAFFEYLGRCPGAGYRFYSLTRAGEPAGLVLMSSVRGQARVAGVWLSEASDESFGAAYTLSQRVARDISGAYEFVAKGVEGAAGRAAAAAGLRVVSRGPVFVLDKKSRFTPPADFQFQLIDDDGSFLDIGRANYLT